MIKTIYKYRLAWQHKTENVSGFGDWLESIEILQGWIYYSSREWPDFNHWIETEQVEPVGYEKGNQNDPSA